MKVIIDTDFIEPDSWEDNGKMLAVLIANGVAFCNNQWYREDLTEEHKNMPMFFTECNDFFHFACADAESITTLTDIVELYKLHVQFPKIGHLLWAIKKRQMLPMPEALEWLLKQPGMSKEFIESFIEQSEA